MKGDTIWTQCLMRIIELYRLRGREEIDLKEVDRLALLVTQELNINVEMKLMQITQDSKNGFDEDIPF